MAQTMIVATTEKAMAMIPDWVEVMTERPSPASQNRCRTPLARW